MTDLETNNRSQFSLRTLFSAVSLLALMLAVGAVLGFDFILKFSGFVLSLVLVLMITWSISHLERFATTFTQVGMLLIIPALYFCITFAFYFLGETVDQPHPTYARGNWITLNLAPAFFISIVTATIILALIPFDYAFQSERPPDVAFYPKYSSLFTSTAKLPTRLLAIVGLGAVLGYYSATVIEVWSNEQFPGGWVWPPKRVLVTCNLIWAVFWVADCVNRPNRGTIVGAFGYLLIALVFVLPMGFGVLRE